MDKHETIGNRFKKLRTSQIDKYGKELPGVQMAQKLIDTQCITNYSADVIRQEISKVEKGKFPQLYLIKGYSKYFNVTSDFLLGLRETKTVDENIAMISRVTGLSDISIDRLKKYTKLQRDIIDKLLSTKAMDKIIEAYIYRNSQYFQKIEIIDSICGKRVATDKENSDFHFFQSVEMLKDALAIVSNDRDLFFELNDIHGEVAKEKMWKIAIDMEIENIGLDATIKNITKDKKHVPDYIFDYVKELQNKKNDD